MRHGLYLPNQGPFADVRALARMARDAEDAGWDGLFIWDAIVPIVDHAAEVREALNGSTDVADPFIALTAIAAATERLRFGALVHPLSRLRPEIFASQAATLDHYSGGRLIVGAGLGSPVEQFSAFGFPTDARRRAAMLDEFLDIVTRLWNGERLDVRGAHYTIEGFSLAPAPLQRPRIPIWIGADSKNRAPRRRAARWDGFAPASDTWPDGVISVEDYRFMVEEIRGLRGGGADERYDVVLIGNVDASLPAPEALAEYAEAGVTWALTQALSFEAGRERIERGPPAA